MRLPVISDMHINAFSGAGITELESGITNGVGEKRGEINYLTQRPPIDMFGDASDDISDARGRAIYYWNDASALYIFNADTIYKTNYGTILSASPTTGTKKCVFLEIGGELVLLDSENGQGWVITTAGGVTEITDTDFPPKQTPAVPLAYGGAVLDTYLFVLGTNGTIYQSATLDASVWGALDFLNASREPDGGVYLGKHHDNIVVLGFGTIEFFYDAGNSVGSVLSRRQDLSYNTGCSSGESVWEEDDRLFWVGPNSSGSLGVYTMMNFQLKKISTSTIDSFITQAIERDGYSSVGCGLSGQGHIYYTLTLYRTPSDVSPEITLVWDDVTGLWSEWYSTVNDMTKFDLIAWTKRGGASERFGEGIISNGDLISINDSLGAQDTLVGATYVTTGYVVAGYVKNTSDTGTAIEMKSRPGMVDGGTNQWKYPTEYRFVGDETANSQTLTLKWSNENNLAFNTGRTMDTSKYQKITRCGRFRRRNHELSYAGTDRIRLEAIEGDMPVGDN